MKHLLKWILPVCVLALLLAGCKKDKEYAVNISDEEAGQTVEDTTPAETQTPTHSAVVEWEDTEDAGSTDTTVVTTQPTTQPTETTPVTENTQPGEKELLTWQQYQALSNEDKQTYYKTFATVEEFYRWKDKAQQEYAQQNKDNVVTGDGSLNLGDYMGN